MNHSRNLMLSVAMLAAFTLAANAATKTIYLDPGRGTAEGTGTESAPFWTFESAVAAAGSAAEKDIVVYVDNSKNGHRFDRDETVAVNVPQKNITFRPWTTTTTGDFKVILDGQSKCSCVAVSDTVTNNTTFKSFVLRNGYDPEYGGGAYSVWLEDSTITNCTALKGGGGVSGCVLTNCQILGCTSVTNGGGAYNSNLYNCQIDACTSVTNGGGAYKSNLYSCRITGCSAAEGNGGGACESKLYNCLVLKNSAPRGYGGGAYHSSLFNCTLDGNTAKTAGGYHCSEKEVWDTAVTVLNSIILDNGADSWAWADREEDLIARNFTDGDPKFVDPANGDYRLRADSPCIDAGYRVSENLPSTDFNGNPRLRGAEVDLGCCEFQRHAAFQAGTLDASTNAQVIGAVMYAQGPWSISVNEEAKSWLSADVTSGAASNSLHFTFSANATGVDRSAVISVYTNGSTEAVQQVTVRQVGSATGAAGTRRGVFVGCDFYGPDPDDKNKPWQKETKGASNDAKFHRDLWCKPSDHGTAQVCQILTNQFATAFNVSNAVNTILAKLQPNDEFMLCISGHGETTVPKWENSFTLYPNKENLYFHEISNILTRAAENCAKAICCIDACNASGVFKFADQLTCDSEITDRREMPRLTLASIVPSKSEPYLNKPKIAFIVASDFDQFAKSGDPDGNGQFTEQIKAGFDTGAADSDGDGVLNLHELYRYAYYAASHYNHDTTPKDLVQGRCYNQPLLLKTIVGTTTKRVKPEVVNPVNPYYVDFVNWVQNGSFVNFEKPESPKAVTNIVMNKKYFVPLKGGGQMSLADAFIAGYAPVKAGATNEPFKVTIAVTNNMPYLSWSPDRRKDAVQLRTYTIQASNSLTNKNWTTLPANTTPADLKAYKLFRVNVDLRQ